MSGQTLTSQASTSPALAAWLGLLRGHAGSSRALSAQLAAEHGLTINDYEALLLLSRAPNQAMRRIDLAGSLVLTASGVTRLLNGLEAAGWVARDACPSDARVSYAVLTESGRDKLAAASCSHVAAIRSLFEERYSAAELATLAELLARLPGAAPACAEGQE